MTSLWQRTTSLCLFFVGLFLLTGMADTASGMTYSWAHPTGKERIVFSFAKTLPSFSVSRTARQTITLTLPESVWDNEELPTAVDLRSSRIITGIMTSGYRVAIKLNTPAFGFIYFPKPESKQIILDIFRDPMGNQWQKPQPRAKTTAPSKTEPQKAANKKPAARPKSLPRQSKKAALAVTQKKPTPRTPKSETRAERMKNSTPKKQATSPQTTPTKITRPKGNEEKQPQPKQAKAAQTPPPQSNDARDKNGQPPSTGAMSSAKNQPRASSFRRKVKFQTAMEAFKAEETAPHKPRGQHLAKQADKNGEKILPPQKKPPVVSKAPQQSPAPKAKQPDPPRAKKQAPPPAPAAPQKDTTASTSSDAVNATSTPDFNQHLLKARGALQNGNIDAALEILRGMLDHPELPEPLREDALYLVAESLFQKFHKDLNGHFSEVMSAFQMAVTADPKSLRLPSALLSMGLINLKVNNIPEAKGYFKLLRSKYPHDSNVPLTYYYMGEHYLKEKDYQKAADDFQYLIQNHPDNSMAQSSAVGLTKALKELGYYKQSYEIMDYIQKRWPRYYIKDPEFLMLAGYIDLKNKLLKDAKSAFWTYANLTPDADKVDIALARIGDIYVMTGHKKAALEVYEKTAEQFPDKEGGLIAKMRLAEEGVFDEPSLKTMFSVFDKPYSLRPKQVYTQIIEKYPESPLAPVAHLKLAMWQLWSDKFKDTLQTVAGFAHKYPDQELLPKALDVGNKAFSQWIAKAVKREQYKDIISTWNKYPFLHTAPKPMTRLAVATSFWKIGNTSKALEMAEPFLSGKIAQCDSSGPALDLVLNILVQSQSWQTILDMTRGVKQWELEPDRRRQFEYTLALAHENLGQEDKAHHLWQKLASEVALPDSQRAYAMYFLARYAERAKDFQNEYMQAQQALSLFLNMPQKDLPKIRDCLDMLIRVTSRTRRPQEALAWGLEFEKYTNEEDPSWPGHMYTLANLFKQNQDMAMWEKKLMAITKKYPDSIYSKMASSDLEAAKLQKKVKPFK